MKKTVIIALAVGALGIAYWLISPLFIDKKISETAEEIKKMAPVAEEPVIAGQGAFRGADSFHKAQGTAKLIKAGDKYFVRFEDDFKITNGPDLFVYFGKNGAYLKEAQIAALKGNIGSQNYEVPVGLYKEDYNEIWVWCRAFAVPFGHAVLNLL